MQQLPKEQSEKPLVGERADEARFGALAILNPAQKQSTKLRPAMKSY
jgi:hypothetical protein